MLRKLIRCAYILLYICGQSFYLNLKVILFFIVINVRVDALAFLHPRFLHLKTFLEHCCVHPWRGYFQSLKLRVSEADLATEGQKIRELEEGGIFGKLDF